MRYKIALLIALLLIGGSVFLMYEKKRYNMVSFQELLTVREKLKTLSPQEKQDLTFFIKQAISFDPYPYTLVGYKPMSITNVVVEDTEDLLARFGESLHRPRHQTLRRGFLVWEKYQALFPRGKCILIDYSFLGKGRKEIAIIDPKLCLATIQEHLDDFRKVLGSSCTGEEVFWILTHPDHSHFYTMIDRTRLVGILLGFGRSNAVLYEQYVGGVSRSDLKPRESQRNALQFFHNEWPWPGGMLSPSFACDPTTEETQQLRKRYNEARKFVHWTYFLRNKLEVTLALLIQS